MDYCRLVSAKLGCLEKLRLTELVLVASVDYIPAETILNICHPCESSLLHRQE